MPLPPHPVTITGGCCCTAIRYRVTIPAILDRPFHPTFNPASGREPVRLPFVCVDHCNDCRRATGALLGVVMCSPTALVELSLDSPTPSREDGERTWFPAAEIFPPGTRSRENTTMRFYESSEGRTRAFCGNCGTHFMYSAYPYPEGWPRMLDIWIGSVDQEVLEKDWLIPERHLWWDVGIEWVRTFGAQGSSGAPKHGLYKVDEEVLV